MALDPSLDTEDSACCETVQTAYDVNSEILTSTILTPTAPMRKPLHAGSGSLDGSGTTPGYARQCVW